MALPRMFQLHILTITRITLFTNNQHLVNVHMNADKWQLEFQLVKVVFQFVQLFSSNFYMFCLQCFDAVGWAAGRASGLYKTEW